MELWIRSQDKMLLRKPEQLGISEGDDFWYIAENLTVEYGRYKTKERALEVLDEIQQSLLDNDIPYTGAVISFNNKIVYVMPEE